MLEDLFLGVEFSIKRLRCGNGAVDLLLVLQSLLLKDLDLTLPGWGEWGGGGLVPSKRKRRRFTIKAPPAEKRRDENSGHLILNLDKDTKLSKHQVSNVPFPFTAVSDFEVRPDRLTELFLI